MCDLIRLLDQNGFSQDLNYELTNHLWNGSLVIAFPLPAHSFKGERWYQNERNTETDSGWFKSLTTTTVQLSKKVTITCDAYLGAWVVVDYTLSYIII